MPEAVRINDICTGHDCHPPRPVVDCSSDVFINRRGAVNQSDMWMVHSCEGEAHPGTGAHGSSSVMINGIPAMRVGDPINCGSFCMTGSTNVMIGG